MLLARRLYHLHLSCRYLRDRSDLYGYRLWGYTIKYSGYYVVSKEKPSYLNVARVYRAFLIYRCVVWVRILARLEAVACS